MPERESTGEKINPEGTPRGGVGTVALFTWGVREGLPGKVTLEPSPRGNGKRAVWMVGKCIPSEEE